MATKLQSWQKVWGKSTKCHLMIQSFILHSLFSMFSELFSGKDYGKMIYCICYQQWLKIICLFQLFLCQDNRLIATSIRQSLIDLGNAQVENFLCWKLSHVLVCFVRTVFNNDIERVFSNLFPDIYQKNSQATWSLLTSVNPQIHLIKI